MASLLRRAALSSPGLVVAVDDLDELYDEEEGLDCCFGAWRSAAAFRAAGLSGVRLVSCRTSGADKGVGVLRLSEAHALARRFQQHADDLKALIAASADEDTEARQREDAHTKRAARLSLGTATQLEAHLIPASFFKKS